MNKKIIINKKIEKLYNNYLFNKRLKEYLQIDEYIIEQASNKYIYFNKCIYINKIQLETIFNLLNYYSKINIYKNNTLIMIAYNNEVYYNELNYYIKDFIYVFYNMQSFRNFHKIYNYYLTRHKIHIIDINNTYISPLAHIGQNTIIYPNSYILGKSDIGINCIIKSSYIEDSIIKDYVSIGPFANIRQNSFIDEHCRIGNFVEIKESIINNNTNCAHLSYIGDSTIGKFVNFGCGSITVNYDGKNKNITKIDDYAFIGCNVNLIAPINIGKNAYICAGSTIYNNVDENDFSIARSYQINKKDYAKKYPYYKKNNDVNI